MLQKILLIVTVGCLAVTGCQQRSDSEKSTGETKQHDRIAKESAVGTTATDTIPAGGDHAQADDHALAAKLREWLPVLLEKELIGADSSARRFVFQETDLNGDGKSEIWVRFTGMNWCGSGGCTALVLSPEGKLVTRFTVIDFPVTILEKRTKNWNDLVAYSGGANRLLQFDGSTYPANPSVAPKYKEKLPDGLIQVLALNTKPFSWYTF